MLKHRIHWNLFLSVSFSFNILKHSLKFSANSFTLRPVIFESLFPTDMRLWSASKEWAQRVKGSTGRGYLTAVHTTAASVCWLLWINSIVPSWACGSASHTDVNLVVNKWCQVNNGCMHWWMKQIWLWHLTHHAPFISFPSKDFNNATPVFKQWNVIF